MNGKNAIVVNPGNNVQYNIYLLNEIDQIRKYSDIDIHILIVNTLKINKHVAQTIVKKYNNVYFTDITSVIDKIHLNQITHNRFSIMTFLKLCVPIIDVFDIYDKILHLDTDIIINKNFDDIFNYDMGDNYLGMCIDPVINNDFNMRYMTSLNYKLKPENIQIQDLTDKYYNAGVTLFNNRLFRTTNCTELYMKLIKMIDLFFKYNFELVDQDVINLTFANKIMTLDGIYNRSALDQYDINKIKIDDATFVHYFGIPSKIKLNSIIKLNLKQLYSIKNIKS